MSRNYTSDIPIIRYDESTKHLFNPNDDLRGHKFGRLQVVEYEYKRNKNYYYKCICDCGKECVKSRGYLIYESASPHKSCGCWRREMAKEINQRGKDLYKAYPEYAIWTTMKRRCSDSKEKSYKNYGGRGIKVCDRWNGEHSFENFITDMGRRPSPQHSIDRIDNNGDYCPENCRWATRKEQCNNRRSNIRIEYQGKTQTLKQWCEEFDIPYRSAITMYKRGKTLDEIIAFYKMKHQ